MHAARFPLPFRAAVTAASVAAFAFGACKEDAAPAPPEPAKVEPAKVEPAKGEAPKADPAKEEAKAAPAEAAKAVALDPHGGPPKDTPPLTGKSALTDPCPGAGEDPAACPKKPDSADPAIKVAHVLIGWTGSLPGKKLERTPAQALELAKQVAHLARVPGADFVQLMWKHSGDSGPGVYDLSEETKGRYMPEFSAMGLSLGVGQVDVVATQFGYHVMKRVPLDFSPPAKPIAKVVTDACPGDGEDAAACPTEQKPAPTGAKVLLAVVGWDGAMRARAKRSQDEARTLTVLLVHELRRKGADFFTIVDAKVKGETPGEPVLDVKKDMPLPPAMKSLALSLGVGQVDAVETDFGYMIMKRVAADYVRPEPPLVPVMTDACPGPGEDPASCPAKTPANAKEAEVTHILVAYQGAARSQATRTKDEAKALAIRICHDARKKGADFLKIKAEAKSDDPGEGTYPIKPDSPMVPPFKKLSLSLGVGQVDIVESEFGYHVMKRNK